MSQSTDGLADLAPRLNALFERVPQQAGSAQLHGNASAAKALAEMGVQVTPNHLGLLRSGRRDNPSARLLGALADLFDVPVTYFFSAEVADKIIADLDLLASLRDTEVRAILARATGTNDAANSDLVGLLRQIRRLEDSDHG